MSNAVRLARPEEMNLVWSSWLKSFSTSSYAQSVTPDEDWKRKGAGPKYYASQKATIAKLLARTGVELRVVELDGLVSAWACIEPGVVHYAYVRQIDRGKGLFRAVLEDHWGREAVYTHRSRALLRGKLPSQWVYDETWLRCH